MTRKDVELIARTIKDLPGADMTTAGRDYVAWRFAEACRAANANFNGEKFLKACGVKS
jgi:hypothetical protein